MSERIDMGWVVWLADRRTPIWPKQWRGTWNRDGAEKEAAALRMDGYDAQALRLYADRPASAVAPHDTEAEA